MAEDTYRIRLVLERCVHTAIGNWQDTQELNSHIFVVSNNKSEVESKHDSLKAKADSQPALLKACKKLTNIVEVVGHCTGVWTSGHQALAQQYAAEAREAIYEGEDEEAKAAIAADKKT